MNDELETQEDALTWLQLDSAKVALLKTIANEESDLALYAQAALELRGDTIIKRHPEESYGGSSQRLSFFEEETKPMKTGSKLEIYPNPSKGLLNIESSEIEGDVIVSLFDISGRTIYSNRIVLRKNSPTQLNVSNISNGLYFIQTTQNGEPVNTSKIVFE